VGIEWQKSSFSTDTDNCVEVARDGAGILLRESDVPNVRLRLSHKVLHSLLNTAKIRG